MSIRYFGNVLLAAAPLTGLAGCTSSSTPNQSTTETPQSTGTPIAIADLPQAVVDGVQKEMPGAVLGKARKASDGNYHLTDVKLGKQEYDLTVSPDGKVLQKEEDKD